ncbi:Uncharacterised protein [uncultured archaeon]|nr:Uncharacterised protein [uncultured archaeon]
MAGLRGKRKKLHFDFDSHLDGQKYITHRERPLRGSKTIVFEFSSGLPTRNQRVLKRVLKETDEGTSNFLKSMARFTKNTGKKRMVPGEFTKTGHLNVLHETEQMIRSLFLITPTFGLFKNLIDVAVEIETKRHALIKNTLIKSLKRGRVETRYGSTHSILSAELRREGIDSSRTMKSIVSTHYERLLRRILSEKLGAKPPTILDYKRAAVDVLFSKILNGVLKKAFNKSTKTANSSDYRFLTLFASVSIGNLKEEQLNEIIQRNDPSLILKYNGIPTMGEIRSSKEMRDLMAKVLAKSSFFRRQPTQMKK